VLVIGGGSTGQRIVGSAEALADERETIHSSEALPASDMDCYHACYDCQKTCC
jgi:hypothetical protein